MLEILLAVYLFIGGFMAICSAVAGAKTITRKEWTDPNNTSLIGLMILLTLLLVTAFWPLLVLGSLIGQLAAWFGKRR